MSSQRFYNALAAAALIGGEAGESDDENLVESDEDDEEYLPPLQQTYWSEVEESEDEIDSGIYFDANLRLFGEIRRFFDQMGHFCESSRTDEKNLGVLAGTWATVNALSLFRGQISFVCAVTELRP